MFLIASVHSLNPFSPLLCINRGRCLWHHAEPLQPDFVTGDLAPAVPSIRHQGERSSQRGNFFALSAKASSRIERLGFERGAVDLIADAVKCFCDAVACQIHAGDESPEHVFYGLSEEFKLFRMHVFELR